MTRAYGRRSPCVADLATRLATGHAVPSATTALFRCSLAPPHHWSAYIRRRFTAPASALRISFVERACFRRRTTVTAAASCRTLRAREGTSRRVGQTADSDAASGGGHTTRCYYWVRFGTGPSHPQLGMETGHHGISSYCSSTNSALLLSLLLTSLPCPHHTEHRLEEVNGRERMLLPSIRFADAELAA